MFVSEYLDLDDELDKMGGVFDCVLDNDSRFLNPAGAAHRVPLQKLGRHLRPTPHLL